MLELRVQKRLVAFDLDVAIAADPGILVLFGPSGAGKSMLLRVIAGVDSVDRGYIRLGDRVLLDTERRLDLDPRQRRVGYVPQHYALFPHLSALDNVAYPMVAGRGWRRSEARSRGRELLAQVGLAERADARPGQLSGGQQQRVALARAVAADPEVLLLDEPLAALDAPTRLELRELLQTIQRDLDIPVVFVTHDLEEAVTVGATMAVMVGGRARQHDAVSRVLDAPADRIVAELVQARNVFAGVAVGTVDGMSVETPVGLLRSRMRRPDGAIDVVVRPDMLRLLADDDLTAGAGCLLTGVVIELIDYGTRATVVLAIADGRLEVAVSRGDIGRLGIRRGLQSRVFVPASAVHLVTPTDARSSIAG